MVETVTKKCEHCHRSFEAKTSRVIRGEGRYCSRACSKNSFVSTVIPSVPLTCRNCGRTFMGKAGRTTCSNVCGVTAPTPGPRR